MMWGDCHHGRRRYRREKMILLFILVVTVVFLERTFHRLVSLTNGNDTINTSTTTTATMRSGIVLYDETTMEDLAHLPPPQPDTTVGVVREGGGVPPLIIPRTLNHHNHNHHIYHRHHVSNTTTTKNHNATTTLPMTTKTSDRIKGEDEDDNNDNVQKERKNDNRGGIRIPDQYTFLLTVPFYIYEEFGSITYPYATFTLLERSNSSNSSQQQHQRQRHHPLPLNIEELDPMIPIHTGEMELKSKHADDYYFMIASIQHPMRTFNPMEAKLFFIPTPFNMLVERNDLKKKGHDQLCWTPTTTTTTTTNNNKDSTTNFGTGDDEEEDKDVPGVELCNRDFIEHVDTKLGQSKWYRRNKGTDHIAIVSHWRWLVQGRRRFTDWKPFNIYNCNLIDFEGEFTNYRQKRNNKKRRQVISYPSYYVGKRCRPVRNKTQDFAMIATFRPSDGHALFKDRTNICKWVQKGLGAGSGGGAYLTKKYSMDACGPIGSQCPALAQAKFGFHVKGDTFGSNRPMDTLLSHTIPIFTRRKQYDVLPPWINWDLISYFADVSNRTILLQHLEEITNDDTTYHQKQQNVLQNQDLFDYNTIVPFDTYMYMFQIHVYPETKHNNSNNNKYTALRLP